MGRIAAVTVVSVMAWLTMTPVVAQGTPVGGGGADYYLNDNVSAYASSVFTYGRGGDDTFFGDWNGDSFDTPLIVRDAYFHLRNSNSSGPADIVFRYGRPGDAVLVGDWDGDGKDTLAVRRGATYYVKNTLVGGEADIVFTYGRSDDVVLVGDWDGNGADTLAVRRESTYHVKNLLAGGSADYQFDHGTVADIVLVGDWDGDGSDTLGIRRDATNSLTNSISGGEPDIVFSYGRPSDTAFAGDWNGDGRDSIAVRRPPLHPVWLTGTVTAIDDVVPYSGTYDVRNGLLSPSILCLVPFMPSHYVHCPALADLNAFGSAYRGRFGEALPIDTWDRSVYRTLVEQEQTWLEIGPPIAAAPGTSPHGWGMAVDMFEGDDYDFGSARYEWMLVNGPRFGWENKPWHWETGSVPEPWHFDYVR